MSYDDIKIWNQNMQLIGWLDLLTYSKEKWIIQMINQTKKEQGLLKTKQIIEDLLNNIVNVKSKYQTAKKIQEDANDAAQAKKKKHKPDQNNQELNIMNITITPDNLQQKLLDLDQEFNNRQLLKQVISDGADEDKIKKQRQKQDDIDTYLNEAIKDSRYLLRLNNKFNHIYKVQSLQGINAKEESQNYNSRMHKQRPKKVKKFQQSLVSIKSESKKMPDYIDYLKSKETTQKLVDQSTKSRSEIRRQLQQDIQSKLKFPKVDQDFIVQSNYPSINQSQVTERNLPKIESKLQIGRYSDIQLDKQNQSKLANVNDYLQRAKDLMRFLEFENTQLGI